MPPVSIVNNLILLSLVELNNSLHRCLTVVKARGSKHSFESCEYEITQGGLKLMPDEGQPFAAQLFSRYSSILSRAPTRVATHQPLANGAGGSK